MLRSRGSVKRFLRFFLGIEETPHTYHQTLTFGSKMQSPRNGKAILKKLLDSLHKKFPTMASLYVEEFQENGNVHFHLRLYFLASEDLPVAPSKLEEALRSAIFQRWSALNGRNVGRPGNRLSVSKDKMTSLRYLCEGITLVRDCPSKSETSNWWGCRNKKRFKLHFTRLSNAQINDQIRVLFRQNRAKGLAGKTSAADKQQEPLTKRSLDFMKAYLETSGSSTDWETHKRRDTGSVRKVSDADYLRFLNRDSGPCSDEDSDGL